MHKRLILNALVGLFVTTPLTAAHAEERPWYFTVDAGISSASDPTFASGRLTTRRGVA
jgi:hypothetical protein